MSFIRNILRSRQTRVIVTILFTFGFLILYFLLTQPHDNNLMIQITFLSLAYLFIFLPFSIRVSRNKMLSIIGYGSYTFKKWHIVYYVFIFLFLLPFTLYALTSVPNNPLRPETPFNPYYLIPDSFRFYLIVISATLGGLVLTASNNNRLEDGTRREFINVSKKFIVATILLIFFVIFYFNSNIYGNIEPTNWEEHITIQGSYIAVMWWASVFCFYIGIILFLLGIFDLIISLSNISITDNSDVDY